MIKGSNWQNSWVRIIDTSFACLCGPVEKAPIYYQPPGLFERLDNTNLLILTVDVLPCRNIVVFFTPTLRISSRLCPPPPPPPPPFVRLLRWRTFSITCFNYIQVYQVVHKGTIKAAKVGRVLVLLLVLGDVTALVLLDNDIGTVFFEVSQLLCCQKIMSVDVVSLGCLGGAVGK